MKKERWFIFEKIGLENDSQRKKVSSKNGKESKKKLNLKICQKCSFKKIVSRK